MGVDCLFGLAWWQQDKQQQQTAMAMARVNGFAQETDGRQTLPVGSLQSSHYERLFLGNGVGWAIEGLFEVSFGGDSEVLT